MEGEGRNGMGEEGQEGKRGMGGKLEQGRRLAKAGPVGKVRQGVVREYVMINHEESLTTSLPSTHRCRSNKTQQ